MNIIDKIKKDAEKDGLVVPQVSGDVVFVDGRSADGLLKIKLTSSAEETINSVEALNYVLKEQYGQKFADRVLARVYKRSKCIDSKAKTTGLLKSAYNKAAAGISGNLELAPILNIKTAQAGFLPEEPAITKLNISGANERKHYSGPKCCYVPKMYAKSLKGTERSFGVDIDIVPATLSELEDFLEEIKITISYYQSKMPQNEYQEKEEALGRLAVMLAEYHNLRKQLDGGQAEMIIYGDLATLINTAVFPIPDGKKAKPQQKENGYQPAADNAQILELEAKFNPKLRVYFEQGKNPSIVPNFLGNYVDISGYSHYSEVPEKE